MKGKGGDRSDCWESSDRNLYQILLGFHGKTSAWKNRG